MLCNNYMIKEKPEIGYNTVLPKQINGLLSCVCIIAVIFIFLPSNNWSYSGGNGLKNFSFFLP